MHLQVDYGLVGEQPSTAGRTRQRGVGSRKNRGSVMSSRWLVALAMTFELVFSSLASAASREALMPRIHEAVKEECCQASDKAKRTSSLNRLRLFWAIVPDPELGESEDNYLRRIEEHVRTVVSECRNYENVRTSEDRSCRDLLDSF
jgi:hypothetical protein